MLDRGWPDIETADVLAPAGQAEVFGAWVLLERGLMRGVTLLDMDLEPLVLMASDPVRDSRPACAFRLREPQAAYAAACEEAIAPGTPEQAWAAARRLGLRGIHHGLRQAVDTLAAVAEHDVPVLIEGETGTGKTLFARLLHVLSRRARGPLVAVNCAAIPGRLVESVLFGHRKGAFTGATGDQQGKFEQADGGTLFLDELGELPLELQPKLLKVLDDQVVEPVGARAGRKVNVRVVAATNRDLRRAMIEGRFREDLYYRVAFGLVRLPPLRDRREDIPVLADHLIGRINAGLRTPKRLSPEALAVLQAQPWQGNVRDLENVIGRSVLLARGDVIGPGDLVLEAAPPAPAAAVEGRHPEPHDTFSLEEYLASVRRSLIRRALQLTHGNQSAAARKLGLTPQAVSRFVRTQQP